MANSDWYPRLRDDLVVSEQESDGQKYYVLKDPITFRYFRLREPEYFLIRQFDGQTNCTAVAKRFQEKFQLNVPAEAVTKFAEKVDSLYFFESARAEYEVSSSKYLGQKKKSLFSRMLFVKLKAFNPEWFLNSIYPVTKFLFHPLSVFVMMLFIIAGFFVYSLNLYEFKLSVTALFSISSIVTIILSLALIIFIHEFAHALTCHHFGGKVREMGFLLLYFQISFYSNLSDSWLFKNKSHRLAVIWAGLFFQMILFAIAVFGWRITVIGTGINDFFRLTANICFIMLLFNFNPLIKLDGYYLLSEIVNIPNLRSRAFHYVVSSIKQFLGIEIQPIKATDREKRVFRAYTLFAGLYSVFLILFVGVILYRFLVNNLGAFGFILFLALLMFMFKTPVVNIITFVTRREVILAMVKKPRNIIIGSIVLIGLVIVLFFIPFPFQVGGNVTIAPVSEYNIYHMAEGRLELTLRKSGDKRSFSTEHILLSSGDLAVLKLIPLVKEGDTVHIGDTLATIVSNQVSTSLETAQSELKRLQNEIALAKSPPKPEEIATANAAVHAAKTTVEQLKKDIERDKLLFAKKLIAEQEMEQAEANLKVARSVLDEAKAKLRLLKSPPKPEEIDILNSQIAKQESKIRYLTTQKAAQVITSPIQGTVVAYYRQNLLLKIADMSRVEITIPVTDNFLEYIPDSATVHVKVRSFASRVFNGRITQISGSANNRQYGDNQARFPVYAILDNPNGMLRDGMSGYAKIVCGHLSLAHILYNRIKAYIRVEFWSLW